MSDQTGTFDYRGIAADIVAAMSRAAIADAESRVSEAIGAAFDERATFGDVVGRLDQALGDLWDANGQSGFMVRVHPDEAVRAAAQAADEQVTAWRRSLLLRDDVAAAVARYATTPDAGSPLDGEERRLLERWQRDLRRAGHDLPAEVREELRALSLRLNLVRQLS
jgi:Zn-dependent oligopeptidase